MNISKILSILAVFTLSVKILQAQSATYEYLNVTKEIHLPGGLTQSLTNDDSPHIYRSRYIAGGAFPFNANGHLVLQPRTSANRSIVFLNGSLSPNPKMVIQHDGNVGIGTTNPDAKLHLLSNSSDGLLIESNGWAELDMISVNDYRSRLTINVSNGDLQFRLGQGPSGTTSSSNSKILIKQNGNVGIGSSNPTSKLTVKGDIHAEEVRVDLSVPGPDYVFEEDYDLPSLESIQDYIRENKHLPEVPSAAEMEEEGINLGVMNMLLLKKVEELTLYTLLQEEKINKLLVENASGMKDLKSQIAQLMLEMKNLKSKLSNALNTVNTP